MAFETSALLKIQKYIKDFQFDNYKSSPIEKKQYNFETTITKNNEKIKLLVYFGKKGVKTVLQGNQLSKEYNEAQKIISGNYTLDFNDIHQKDYNEYIGTDETGKGDYFGPLVIAGMYVNKEIQKSLSGLGVKDSKDLSDIQINIIAKQIRSKYPDNFSIVMIKPEKYNKLYESFKNVNKLLNWAHSKVVDTLLQKISVNTVITDQFSKRILEVSAKIKHSEVEFIQMPKAEKYIGVAAASILARHEMNKWFDKKTQKGINVIKGASYEVEKAAKQILLKYGKEEFEKLVKLHFKTTQKILKEISNT